MDCSLKDLNNVTDTRNTPSSIPEKVHDVTFQWAQGPNVFFLGGGKGAKTVFFYVALASLSCRQPFFYFSNHSIQ